MSAVEQAAIAVPDASASGVGSAGVGSAGAVLGSSLGAAGGAVTAEVETDGAGVDTGAADRHGCHSASTSATMPPTTTIASSSATRRRRR